MRKISKEVALICAESIVFCLPKILKKVTSDLESLSLTNQWMWSSHSVVDLLLKC